MGKGKGPSPNIAKTLIKTVVTKAGSLQELRREGEQQHTTNYPRGYQGISRRGAAINQNPANN